MIGITAIAVGAGVYSFLAHKHDEIAKQEARYQQLMYTALQAEVSSPITQVDAGAPGDVVPVGKLPGDAVPTPGYVNEPGSARPQVIYRRSNEVPVRSVYSIIVEKTDQYVPKTNDPIWRVSLVDGTGKQLETLDALTGRSYRQTANRHQGGNKSPLPGGVYNIDRYGIDRGPFDDPELGNGYWVPITPLFNTGRSALGFHQDPSWGKTNGESGTSGCIGLRSAEATATLVEWIKKYNVNKLIVAS